MIHDDVEPSLWLFKFLQRPRLYSAHFDSKRPPQVPLPCPEDAAPCFYFLAARSEAALSQLRNGTVGSTVPRLVAVVLHVSIWRVATHQITNLLPGA